MREKEGRSSFLKKRSKKLLPVVIRGPLEMGRVCQGAKVFCFFFSKKKTFLPLLLTTSCMVGPDYHRPAAPIPIHYKELSGWVPAQPADMASKGDWWTIYHDPQLNKLESRVEISNQTVREYVAQYAEAQATVQEARAGLFPTIGGTAGVTRSSTGRNTTNGRSVTSTQYTLEATATWDLDVWGRIRRQVQSDVAAAQVSAADLKNAALSAQGTLATDYIELQYQDSLQDLLKATVKAYREALRITHDQVEAGTTSPADEAAAETQLASAEASLVNVGVSRGQYEHAVAVLAGLTPADLNVPHSPLGQYIPVPPPGVPSVLLQRRPDIAAAERMMDEENALIGVQVAAFYPDISLSADYGWEGGPIGMLISAANRIWSLGASATETIFDGGERTAAVSAARAAYDQSVATYRQTVLSAFQQVEDELVALKVLQSQAAAEDYAVRTAQRSVTIALNEYEAGTQAYTSVVTEQTALLTAQEAALQVREQRLQASVALVQALGGGWSTADLPAGKAVAPTQPLF
jgi:NodT family efflux transporter outer membrane factor (OMF) lipoprotein